MGLTVCGSGIAAFIFIPLTNFLLEEYGLRNTMLIEGALFCNAAIFGAAFRPLNRSSKIKRRPPAEQTDDGLPPIGVSKSMWRRCAATFDCSLLTHRVFVLFAISNLLTTIGLYNWFVPIFAFDYSISLLLAAVDRQHPEHPHPYHLWLHRRVEVRQPTDVLSNSAVSVRHYVDIQRLERRRASCAFPLRAGHRSARR